MSLVLKSMPKLVEASFGGDCIVSPVSIFQQISHLAAHLCKLTLETDSDHSFYDFLALASFPIFHNLKHLNMVIKYLTDSDDITRLLEACPLLLELKLELFWFEASSLDEADISDMLEEMDQRKLPLIEQNTHPNLTRLEVGCYLGCYYDVDIILSIMGYACNLETIICDPQCSGRFNDDLVETSRARAYKLKKVISPKISVIVI